VTKHFPIESEDNVDIITNNNSEPNPPKQSFWQKLKLGFKAIKPIITSHHPLCGKFQDHTFHLFGRDWCIGCYIGYPSGILMLLIGYLTGLFAIIPSRLLWTIGGILMSSYLLSIVGLTKIRWIKIVSKIPLGFGAAFVIAAIFSYETKFWVNFLIAFFFLQTFLTIINIKRAIEMRKTCKKCEFKDDHYCPGMGPINRGLDKIKKRE
jgi:hypothetical protein